MSSYLYGNNMFPTKVMLVLCILVEVLKTNCLNLTELLLAWLS